jgi:hypothetical protein
MNPSASSSAPLPRRSSLSLSISLFTFYLYLALALFITLSSAQTFEGCYAIDNNLVLNDTNTFQSKGRCDNTICTPKNYAVFGMTGNECYCGNSIPTLQVTPDHCNMQCPGFPNDTCITSSKHCFLTLRRWNRVFECLVDRCWKLGWKSCHDDIIEHTHSGFNYGTFKHRFCYH